MRMKKQSISSPTLHAMLLPSNHRVSMARQASVPYIKNFLDAKVVSSRTQEIFQTLAKNPVTENNWTQASMKKSGTLAQAKHQLKEWCQHTIFHKPYHLCPSIGDL